MNKKLFGVLMVLVSLFGFSAKAGHPFVADNQMQNALMYLEWMNQMQFRQAMNASLAINWRGTKPLGFSYMPPVGADAIFNSYYYSSAQPAIWGPYIQSSQMLNAR